ncbi:MAG: beta-propeller domain-containing protein [Lachnospiraceae bacterium]|nr:beta-propeller domain-containing protein [Lachnospiraceae bacterium]
MRLLSNKVRRCVAAAVTAVMFTGLFVGCSGGSDRVLLPTPTPRTEKNKENPEATKAPAMVTQVPVVAGSDASVMLKPAGSYEAVYEVLQRVQESGNYRGGLGFTNGMLWVEEEAVDMAVPDAMAPTEGTNDASKGDVTTGGVEFSETNVQVEGIDEADIIKTDGQYFYVFDMNRNAIYIVSAKSGEMKLTAAVPVSEEFDGNETGREMYLLGNRLILLVSGFRTEEKSEYSKNAGNYIPYIRECAVTKVFTYDITDKSAPKLLSSLEQDGRMITSRLSDGKVYVISSYGNYYGWFKPLDGARDLNESAGEVYKDYIPTVEGEPIAPDCIYISEEPVSEEFLVVTSMSPENPEQYLDVKSLLADGDECYVSNNYIYVAGSRWQNSEIPYDRTVVYRFAYQDGEITPAGQVTVKGTLDDQFSMDEYEGHLRVVTTVNEYVYETKDTGLKETVDINGDGIIDETDMIEPYSYRYIIDSKEYNSLYIYNESLELTGCIENLAPDEHIKSARLMGKVGYFVTFRQTDPLFSVDLSDPANPKVLGELKIPGFSTYLHPYGEGLLLGIGYDADETTGWTQGVKLSMFDVSDPGNVKEVHKHILADFTYTGVEADHKAALVDAEKGIIGFPVRGYQDMGEYNVYVVYGYDETDGFYPKFSEGYAMGYEADLYEFKYELFMLDCRGAYIGDTFYMINPAYEIKSYDMETWEQTGRVGMVKEVEERQAMLEQIKEKNPEPIVIEVEANPSTGYTWSTTMEGGAVSLFSVEDITADGDRQLPGAPIIQRYTYEVRDIGTTKVTFEYARMWESKAPLRRIVYVITVDENFEAKIESVTEE